MSKGTEEQFQTIVENLAINCRQYEGRQIKHIQYADKVDAIFQSYGWDKPTFYRELNERLGIQTNETRKKKKVELPKKGTPKKKI